MSDPLLVVEGLNAYYGPAHVLQNVSFSVTEQAVAIIGRNGMGKSTLCAAIMGMTPPRTSGSVRLEGTELIGRASYKIAGLGIGYVPQGRRLFPSLSVDEHLRMVAGRNGGPWNMRRVYELFPRLAERKRNGGAQLSGGEQQMLAIGRALLTNPKLLIMDEPSEGLAPTVIEMLVETFGKFEEEGLRMLLVEQNLVVATSHADRQLVMIGGEIAAETTDSQLVGSVELQRRDLGVEPVAHEADGDVIFRATPRAAARAARHGRLRLVDAVDPFDPRPRLRLYARRRLRALRGRCRRWPRAPADEGEGRPGYSYRALLPDPAGVVAER